MHFNCQDIPVMPLPNYVSVTELAKDLGPGGATGGQEEENASQQTPGKQKGGASTKGKNNKLKRPSSEDKGDPDALKNKRSRKTLVTSSLSTESQDEGFLNIDGGETQHQEQQQHQQQQQQQNQQQTGASFSHAVKLGPSEARLIKARTSGNIWQPQWQVRDTHSLYKGNLKKDVAVELAKTFSLPADAPPIPDVNMLPTVFVADSLMLMGQSMNSMRAMHDLSVRLWDELNDTRRKLQEAQKQMADCVPKEQFAKYGNGLQNKLAAEKQKLEKWAVDKATKDINELKAVVQVEAERVKNEHEETMKKALEDQAAAHEKEKAKTDGEWNKLYAKVSNDVKIALDMGYDRCLEVVKPVLGDITPYLNKSASTSSSKPPLKEDQKKPPKGGHDQKPSLK